MRRWNEEVIEEKWHLFMVWEESGRGKERVGVGEAVVRDLGTKMEDYNQAKQAMMDMDKKEIRLEWQSSW